MKETPTETIDKKRTKKRIRNQILAEDKKNRYYAYFKNAPGSYRKYMPIMDVIRGKNAKEALTLLNHIRKRRASIVAKLIKCALNDYQQKRGIPWENQNLYISRLEAYTGRSLKRWRPAYRGTAHPYRKRYSNIYVEIIENQEKKEPQLQEAK